MDCTIRREWVQRAGRSARCSCFDEMKGVDVMRKYRVGRGGERSIRFTEDRRDALVFGWLLTGLARRGTPSQAWKGSCTPGSCRREGQGQGEGRSAVGQDAAEWYFRPVGEGREA